MAASRPIDRTTLVREAVRLWDDPIFEQRLAVVFLLDRFDAQLRSRDLPLIERMIRESKTWALVDELAIRVVGPLLERHSALTRSIDRWSRDKDFWIRRSALLALLGPLRRGAGDFSRFGVYADRMLDEREFFIRKAIGWVLRETGKRRPGMVYRWLLPRVPRASGVTLREAVRYLEPDQRQQILTKATRKGRS
jgi:3-methyladenine DNA glycosylase AlkD